MEMLSFLYFIWLVAIIILVINLKYLSRIITEIPSFPLNTGRASSKHQAHNLQLVILSRTHGAPTPALFQEPVFS